MGPNGAAWAQRAQERHGFAPRLAILAARIGRVLGGGLLIEKQGPLSGRAAAHARSMPIEEACDGLAWHSEVGASVVAPALSFDAALEVGQG